MFTPSKIGGMPAWISPVSIPQDIQRCEKCGHKLCFVGQVYANLDHLEDYHRMLYMFVCVSEQCIHSPDSFQAIRCVIHEKNPHIKFATDDEYNQIYKKGDQALQTTGKWMSFYDVDKADEAQIDTTKQKDDCILKEYLLVTEEEDPKDTQFYLRHSERLNNPSKSKDGADDAEKEQLEQAFLALNFKKAKDVNDKAADKLLAAYKLAEAADNGNEEDDNDFEESKETIKDIESKHLEDFIKEHHTNYSKISDDYKLFEIVTSSCPSQVLRYSS